MDPRVFVVGAGPGNSGLMTLRAAECLRRADLVIYDKLVPTALLQHASPFAEKLCVTEFGPRHCDRVGAVAQKLIESARLGKCVVRLKGGDPFLLGRGGEEAQALNEAGISFEVVPGVTAALGAAAFAGMPLTHRGVSSAVALVTGHDDPESGGAGMDWEALARFPGTLAIYMGVARLAAISQTLIDHGKPADTPAAVVQCASTGLQRTVTGPLRDIAAATRAAGLASPALILIGPVVKLREKLAWFEQLPLLGRRILVCRPREQASELVQRLEELGAFPLVLPVVEIRPPLDWTPVDAAIDRLREFDWLVFTSVNGVNAFLGRLQDRGLDLRALGHLRLAAIGPATAEALNRFHLKPDVVPEEYRSEALAISLKPHVGGKRVLLARADRGRDVLVQELQSIAQVHQVAVYAQVDAIQRDPDVLSQFRNGDVDFVVLTSSNIARALGRMLDAPCQEHLRSGRSRIVSISPVTSTAIKELNWPIAAEAEKYTMAGIVEAILRLNQSSNASFSDASH